KLRVPRGTVMVGGRGRSATGGSSIRPGACAFSPRANAPGSPALPARRRWSDDRAFAPRPRSDPAPLDRRLRGDGIHPAARPGQRRSRHARLLRVLQRPRRPGAGRRRAAQARPAAVAGRGAVPLWWLGGQPAAVLVRHGRGRVLVVPDPSLLTHRGLLREDNVIFLYNVAALDAEDGRVYFDEYHHGIRSGGGY